MKNFSFSAVISSIVLSSASQTVAQPPTQGAPAPTEDPSGGAFDSSSDGDPSATADGLDPELLEQAEDLPPPLPWQLGPKALDLGHGVHIDLPDNLQFLGQPDAGRVMEQMGNFGNDALLGIVTSQDPNGTEFMVIDYFDEGHVDDEEEIDAEELLEQIREGQEAANEERSRRGFLPLTIGNWGEPPHYDKSHHRLVWGLTVSDREGSSVNYSTRILGRTGLLAINLVADPAKLAEGKALLQPLLASSKFVAGTRYEDFNEDTDKVAEYGLAGLVLGGAGVGLAKAAKLGFLAKILLGAKKLWIVIAAGVAGLAKWILRKKDPTGGAASDS